MREPAWQVFHCPGTWIPSNLISPVSLHWSFSCYPLCRVSFLPICDCAGQPAVRLPSASLTFLGAEPLQKSSSWRKAPLNILLFSSFFSLHCCAIKVDIPWVPLQPSPASLSACTSPGTAARLSPAKGHQAAGLMQPQVWGTALWARAQTTNSLGHCLERIWRKCCLQHPPHQGMLTGFLHPAAFHSSHTFPQGILSAIILMISHVDIDITVSSVWIPAAF